MHFQSVSKNLKMKGIVIKALGSRSIVKDQNNKMYNCTLKGNIRLKEYRSTNPVAVGDAVEIEIINDKDAEIINIYEPQNYIARKSSNLSKEKHIIAANIDFAYIIANLTKPITSNVFIDRFLLSAEMFKIKAGIIFNKIDIYKQTELDKMQHLTDIYQKIGYNCLTVSAKESIGLDELKENLKDKVNLFSGNSGVGKSSLINAIDKRYNIKTQEISKYHQAGMHTTTYPQMYELEFGGYIIDTAGIRGFGLIDINKKELAQFFPEMLKELGKCEYYNCTHINEPNCKVKELVEQNKISEERYKSYLSIYFDKNEKYR